MWFYSDWDNLPIRNEVKIGYGFSCGSDDGDGDAALSKPHGKSLEPTQKINNTSHVSLQNRESQF